jgi:nitronate monooxygenase
MWNDTALTRRLGIRYPIVQGPFGGGLSSARLVAAVSNAGGLGSFGAHGMAPDRIRDDVDEIRALTASPFAVNLWVSTEEADADRATLDEQVSALLDARPPALSFVFGIPPADVIDECRRRSVVTIGTATTVDEAVALESSGVDIVVASGVDAGGHRPSFLRSPETSLTGLFSLVPHVCGAVEIPVIAAGGIADGRGVAAALALGADGVQIGTAFLACEESNAPPAHRDALLGLLPYPLHGQRAGALRDEAIRTARMDLIALWGRQSGSLFQHRRAKELFQDLVCVTECTLSRQAQYR